ncbi:hypothetical protein HBI83_061410 [Parastagonospora nodorum]|nr:hypothetical protein HBI83_061410 [Parastagonospora nodorum]
MRLFAAAWTFAILNFVAADTVAISSDAGAERVSPALVRRKDGTRASHSATTPLPVTALWDDDLASDADWEKYTLKGGTLMCGLVGTDRTAGGQIRDTRNPPSAASVWTGDLRQELDTWYWREMSPSSKGCQLHAYWEFPAMLAALELNGQPKSDGGDNECSRVEHWDADKEEGGKQVPAVNQWYKVDGKDYHATKAHYEFIINNKGGAIYGLYLEGPRASASREWYGNKKEPPQDQLPHLKLLSDILWGYWVRDNPDVKNIRYFFMLGISNDQTNQIIASCLKRAKKELKEWPGASFDTSTEEGHALLGSPNGAVFAYFLLQHKADIGHKTVAKITVVRPESDADIDFVDASLVFHVVDAPEPPPDQEGGFAKEMRHDSHTVEMTEQSSSNVVRTHTFQW